MVLAGGIAAQGKHGGGKGGGGDHGNGHGKGGEMKQERGAGDQGKHDNGKGNGNAWGRQKHDDGSQQRIYQQMRQQQDWARQQQRQNDRDQGRQHQQNEWNAKRQQQQNEWIVREQQRQYERAARDAYRQQRDQQRIYQQQQRAAEQQVRDKQSYARLQQQQLNPVYPMGRHDNGRHLGWYKNGKAYAGMNPFGGMFRDWRRSYDDYRDDDRRPVYSQRHSYTYYTYSDPIATYVSAYQQPYNGAGSTRESIVRSLLASFLGGQGTAYYQPYQEYQPYQAPYYGSYGPRYATYSQPYYSTVSYSPGYASDGSPYGYDPYSPYSYSPYDGAQMFSGGGLKSTLLNVGLSLLQGFLGNSYQQGFDQGQYVRDYYDRPVTTYYDPYAVSEPAYYSPLASSFANERRLLEEGYRLGYRDAMLDKQPYGDVINDAPIDLVSQFLANAIS